jgi:NAD(P)-dependent dehydrogenase (short-subunit alcohol dehydrogenase family)
MTADRLLVLGARPDSLGGAVADTATNAGYEVITAGISGEEFELDLHLANPDTILEVLQESMPQHVVCTVGVNMPQPEGEVELRDWYRWHFEANVIGPMRFLEEFARWTAEGFDPYKPFSLRHFVAISSNSASIPRTNSAAYCASKAALSQALRVKAREASGGDNGFIVYGYEPGWLANTPMSNNIEKRFEGRGTSIRNMHRMRGEALAAGVYVNALAAQIVAGLLVPGAALNGATIRYDGGEL